MNEPTVSNSSSLIVSVILMTILAFFVIRYLLMCSSIKKKSKLMEELKKLNLKYQSSFVPIQKRIKIAYECNSLQQYRKNCNKISIINYMCGRVRENEETWKDLYHKANSNKHMLEEYLKEYDALKQEYGGISYPDIKKRTLLFSENQYRKFEEKYCHKKLLKPQTSLHIQVNLSYTSPTGKSKHESEYDLFEETVDEIFARIDDKRMSERSIDYQRALMTSGKRYEILRRDHYRCQICGRSQSDGAKLEVDHIIPVSKGGKTVDENLQTLCHECNQGKKDKM